MFLPVRFRLALLFGAVIFAVQGVCSNDDVFEEMHQVDYRVHNRGLDHLPVLANRLLARDVLEATLTVPADSLVVTANLAFESTETLTSVVTEIKCSRCNPNTTEVSLEPEPTISETTTKKPTDPSTVTKKSTVSATATTEKSTITGTTGGKSTVSMTTTEHPSAPVAPTKESSCSAGPTDPTTGPVPVPTEEPSCSVGPTEPTTGLIPAPTENSTVPGTAIEKTTVSEPATETSCSVELTGPTKVPTPVSTNKPTQPSVGEHPGVPPSSTHIEVTIPITPGQGGPNTLSTLITLATSKGGSGSPPASQLTTTPHPTVGTALGGSTATISRGGQGSGTGTQVPKYTGEAPHFTVNPSPTYYGDGGVSCEKTMSSYIPAVGLSLVFLLGFL